MLQIIITVFHVLFCLTLILVILLQAGRGQGLTGPSFGSGNVQSLFGTRATDFLTKATSVAAICFLLTCISLDFIEAQHSRSLLLGPRKTTPIDIEKVKQALEKVKAEMPADAKKAAEAVKTETAGTQAAAQAAATDAVNETENAAAEVQKQVEQAQPAADEAADQAKEIAKN